jgi:hypothetical protein
LELISNNTTDEPLTQFVNAFKAVPYTTDSSVSISNISYYTALQTILNIYIGLLIQQMSRGVMLGGSIVTLNNQKGGDLTPAEQTNGSDTLMFDLTTLFMSLTVNLNELTESLVSVPVPLDYNSFVNFMKTAHIPDTNTDKILEILDNFFRESWFAIQKAEAVGLNTTEHKKLYYTIYIFFSCLYGKIYETPTVLAFINHIVESNILFDRAQDQINTQFVLTCLIVENTFFNNYISDDVDEKNKILNSIWYDANISTFFKTIIKVCLQERYTLPQAINNFTLIIFTTLFNFFNYCILASNIPGKATDNGFNNGRIIIIDFTTKGTNFFIFIQRIINATKLNIIDSQTIIFKEICKLLSIFSSYFYNPGDAFKQMSELNKLIGGSKKYTKKIYNRKRNTRKHNRKRNTKKYNIKKHKPKNNNNKKRNTRNK